MARAGCLLAAFVGFSVPAHAYTHPCISFTADDLATIKANLNQQPWKRGYELLSADWHSQLTYTMQGPFATVTRNPDLNRWEWVNDMIAVYNLARMWYFTGNTAYAQKAHDILIAWANTQTSWGGQESGLELGDYAFRYAGGADILRGTWPGWTAADTTTVKSYFLNVLWPAQAGTGNTPGTFSKAMLNLQAGMAIALFLDDTAKVNHIIDTYRAYPGTGEFNILPTGETGESGRDAGHNYDGVLGAAFISECAWKQGIDLYSDLDNRLLAFGEYYARNTFALDNPYVPFGTVDATYYANAAGPYSANRSAFYLLQNAYKNRKHLPTPWIDRKLQEQNVDADNFMYARTADFSTATPPAAVVRPAVSVASSGLTLTTLGTQTTGRSSSYANGVWTLTGLGNGVWVDQGGSDDCQFAYKQMTGDCAIVARVTSFTKPGTQAGKCGLMIRDNLSATVSQRGLVDVSWYWNDSSIASIECRQNGWTENWAGTGFQTRSDNSPLGLPCWLKIERKGNLVTGYASQDGASWAPIVSSYYANLPSTAYIGLFLCSGTSTAQTATFANVAFTGGSGGLVTTPAAPAAVFAGGSSKAITVRWLPSFGATSYNLLRSTTSGSGYAAIASNLSASATSYVDTTAAAGTTYYYVVQAANSVGTSGNSSQFGAALLSAPMVNLAFGGTPSASASSGSGYEKSDQAFDLDPGTKWIVPALTGWLQYDFGSGNVQTVKRYTINSADVASRDPKDWQFQGSQDGSTWTTLDTQSGQSFAVVMGQNTYNIGNTTAYRYYRLNITANNGDAYSLAVADLGLWGDSGRTLPDGRYRLVNRKSNKVVDVTGGATANGTPLVQSGWSGADSQQWDIAWQGNGQYRATGVASAKVIDNGGTSTAGANLVIQPSSGTASQRWTIVPDSDGFYRIPSANSGLVADVSGGSTTAGANIVQSTYTGGDSQLWTPSVGVTPQLIAPVPTGLTATAASISQINLSWTASAGAVHYNLKRATVSGGPYTTVATDVSETSYSDTYLTAATTYYYVMSALNGSGESADSAQASATTPSGPPSAPAGVTVTLGTNRVILNWTATGGATSYTVKRATAPGGPYTTIASGLTSPTYTDTSRTSDVAYYYVIVAVNAFGSSSGSTEIAVAPGNLTVHLKFDETGGTVAADSSGFAQNASLVHGPNFAAGFINNGLNFPATANQHAELPQGIMSGVTDFTIATWIKVNAFATWQRIFDFGTGQSNYMYLAAQGPAGAGQPRFCIRTPSIGDQVIDSSIALPTGTWAHVAVTRSGSTIRLYVNGSLAGSGTASLNPSDLGVTTLNYLGMSQFSDPYLNGVLDDFRLYTQTLSASEISALAHPAAGAPTQLAAVRGNAQATLTWIPNATTTYTVKRSTTSGGPYSTVATGITDLTYTDTGLTNDVTYYYVVSGANADGSGPDSAEVSVTPSSLLVHLKFDESSGAVAADSSGRSQNATLVNSPVFAAGKINNALSLTAASSQYATLPSGVVNGLADFTISTWLKVSSFATWQRIFDFGTGQSNYMFLSAQGPAGARRPRLAIRTPSIGEQVIDSSVALATGTWAHVAVTRSGTTVSLYINGSLAGSGSITLGPSDLGATTQNYLGKSQFSDPYLNAALDDFRIYAQAMSASEIGILAAGPLPAPQNVSASPGSSQIALSWNAVSNATGYTVQRASSSGGPYTLIATVTATSYSDSGLLDGATWYYTVTAQGLSGAGTASAPVSATTYTALEKWRLANFGTIANSGNAADAADPDGDGMTNAQEFAAGTGPNDSSSVLRITQLAKGGNDMVISFTSIAGKTYRMERSDTLQSGSWTTVQDNIAGTGGIVQITDAGAAASSKSFYRIVLP